MGLTYEEVHNFLLKFHEASDSFDAPRWINNFWAPDATLQFANYPPIHGRQAIIDMFIPVFATLASMKHDIGHIDIVSAPPNSPEPKLDRVYQAANISYAVKGDESGQVFKVKGMAVFTVVQDSKGESGQGLRVKDFDVYLDMGEVLARIKEVQGKEQQTGKE